MDGLISRQAAIDAVWNCSELQPKNKLIEKVDAIKSIIMVPSAQPEYRLDEWCTDCKEYDHERHCCPRFNRVIRATLQEVQAEQPEIVMCARLWNQLIDDDDFFCADGERRSEDE